MWKVEYVEKVLLRVTFKESESEIEVWILIFLMFKGNVLHEKLLENLNLNPISYESLVDQSFICCNLNKHLGFS